MGYMNKSPQKSVVDLFSGCGGMSLGLHKAGFEIVAGIDSWSKALDTFQLNHPSAKVYSTDIEKLDANQVLQDVRLRKGELDCLIGGPPCQGFSKNVPASSRFFKDPRNQLFKEFLRFVRDIQPKTVLMENVAEIYNAFDGKVREEITSELSKLGYKVNVQVLYAPDLGIPQRRRRCFFFASRTGINPGFPSYPKAKRNGSKESSLFDLGPERPEWFISSAWQAISDLPPLKSGEGTDEMAYCQDPENSYQHTLRNGTKILYDHGAKNLRKKQYDRLASIKPGQGFKDLPDSLRPRSAYSGAYGRLDFQMIAPTITRWVFHPGSGRYGHPRDTRILTIREAARIQSFFDDFRFMGSYTEKAGQIGNAVPPLLTYALAPFIASCVADETATSLSHQHQAAEAGCQK